MGIGRWAHANVKLHFLTKWSEMCKHIFSIYDYLVKKATFKFFERRSGCKIIEQNIPGGLIFSDFSTMYS